MRHTLTLLIAMLAIGCDFDINITGSVDDSGALDAAVEEAEEAFDGAEGEHSEEEDAYLLELEEACADGDESACEELEDIHSDHDGESDEWEEYVAELEEACNEGEIEACEELEAVFSEEAELETEEDDYSWEEYLAELEEACNEGEIEACEELAEINSEESAYETDEHEESEEDTEEDEGCDDEDSEEA